MLGTSLLTSLLPGVDRHSAITTGTITADSSVLLFTLLVSLATGLLAGLLPAFMSSRTNLCSALSDASRSNTGGRSHTRFRNLLIAGEVALSLLVLFSAALLLESFQRLRAVDQGFKPERVLMMSLNLPDSRYKTAAQKTEFFEQLLDRVRAMPGVISAGMTNWLPLNGHWSDSTFEIENHAPLPPGQFRDALFRTADPDYFRTMGIPLIRGRFFKPSERVESGWRVRWGFLVSCRAFSSAPRPPIRRSSYWFQPFSEQSRCWPAPYQPGEPRGSTQSKHFGIPDKWYPHLPGLLASR
jgi:hypothetical protein